MSDEMVMVNKQKVEVLKVFYALFTTLMDSEELSDAELRAKLRILSHRLKAEVTDFGAMN